MPALFLHTFALIITLLIFGYVGYKVSKKLKSVLSFVAWILMIAIALYAGNALNIGILVGIFQFKIYISTSLTALGLGIIVGLAMQEIRRRANAGAKV